MQTFYVGSQTEKYAWNSWGDVALELAKLNKKGKMSENIGEIK